MTDKIFIGLAAGGRPQLVMNGGHIVFRAVRPEAGLYLLESGPGRGLRDSPPQNAGCSE